MPVCLLFQGKFKEAGKTAADAVGKVVLGVEDITDKVADATEAVIEFGKTVVAEVKEAVVVATQLVDQFRAIRDEQQRLIVENAELNKEMETQQKIAEDTNRTYEERKTALENLGAAQVKLAENLANQAKLEEDNLKLQIAQEANYEKREELETQFIDDVEFEEDVSESLSERKKKYEAFMMTGDRMISLAKTPANKDFKSKHPKTAIDSVPLLEDESASLPSSPPPAHDHETQGIARELNNSYDKVAGQYFNESTFAEMVNQNGGSNVVKMRAQPQRDRAAVR